MNAESLVIVKQISKKFCKDLKVSLWYGLCDILTELLGIERKINLRKHEFWAVKDVSFELRRGECLGLIGHNGAGKSTLLKMLNGLIKPDKGQITMKGRVCAIIELGAGFNPILTGRENVFNNGAVLGFTQEQISKKYSAIVEFAELENFMDTPVQNYSSGMKVRLGFAVAAQLEPDVLMIDEVLAVGDVRFRIKCMNIIQSMLTKAAVIFVSHSLPYISRICNTGILLESGKMIHKSNQIAQVIEHYMRNFDQVTKRTVAEENIKLLDIRVRPKNLIENNNIPHGESMIINFELALARKYNSFFVQLIAFNKEQRSIIDFNSKLTDDIFSNTSEVMKIEMESDPITLNPGKYYLTVIIISSNEKKVLARFENAGEFNVSSNYISWSETYQLGSWCQIIN